MPKSPSKSPPAVAGPRASDTSPTTTEEKPVVVEDLSEHRILVSDVTDEAEPKIIPLVIVATSREAAVEIVSKLDNPFEGDLPKGSYRARCRLEEVLPFVRDGYGVRRDCWKINEVALRHPGFATRFDIYLINHNQPGYTPHHLREVKDLGGPDILSEDWSVCAKPITFGNRGQ